MKRLRLPLLAAGAGLLLLVALAGVAYSSWFQTWATRRALAGRAGVQASVGNVSAGIRTTEISDLRLGFRGVTVTLPRVELDVPALDAGWNRRAIVTRLVARDWTMEFAAPPAKGAPVAPADAARVSAEAAVQAFVGVFAQLNLPIDVALDGVDLAGDVVLPEARGRVKVTITGGGLAAGRDAKFAVTAAAALNAGDVKTVELRGELTARMDTPRTFAALGVNLDATAVGPDFPGGVRLRAEASAARTSAGERYAATAVSDGRELITVTADYPAGAPRIDGRWVVKARDADLAPFALGQTLPAFSLAGEGSFDADAGFAAVHVAGRLDATADRLEVLRRELAVLGPLSLQATFDLAQRGGAIAVRQFEGNLGASGPVATVKLLQEFEINPGTRELRTAEVAKDLLAVTLHGAPLAWARPWLGELDPGAARLRGELVATPRNGGVTLRSRAPLTADDFTLSQDKSPLIERTALLISVAADSTPHGWQVEIPGLALRSGEDVMLTFEARAGRLAGKDEPFKVTGRLIADLPRVLAQPGAAGRLALASGEAEINFAATLGVRREVQANLAVKNLAARTAGAPLALPALTADVRADAGPDGAVVFNAPILIERDGRKSDLAVNGTLTPVEKAPPLIEAMVTGAQFFAEDAQLFAAALPPAAPAVAPALPPWAGLNGSVTLRFKEVLWSPALRASNVTGRVRLDAGMIKLEGLQASVGEAGRAHAEGTLTFQAAASQPFALAADVRLKDFDPGPVLRALSGDRAPAVEGRFEITGSVAARAAALGELAEVATNDFALTSKGGFFRLLPVTVNLATEPSGRLATIVASIGGLGGRRADAEIAGRPEAVAEFVRALHPLPYDQFSLRTTRDATGAVAIHGLSLISPEFRITGHGRLEPSAALVERPLHLDLRLRARGRQGALLKYLGALDPKTDDLGYSPCTLPVKVSGTPARPEVSELNARLTALALEKSGVAEKASEFFNRIIGSSGK